jgi:hypothetical protein
MVRFNKKLLIVLVILLFGLLYFSFIAAFLEDEGTLPPDDWIWIVGAKLFYILRFPTHTLFFEVFVSHYLLFIGGLFLNVIGWAFLCERVITLTSYKLRKVLKEKNN